MERVPHQELGKSANRTAENRSAGKKNNLTIGKILLKLFAGDRGFS